MGTGMHERIAASAFASWIHSFDPAKLERSETVLATF